MLPNRKYIGEYQCRDIVQPNGIPAIISKELFDKIQERMVANKMAPAKHKAEDEYLLTTKLFCGKCQYLSGTSYQEKKMHRYYKCVNVKSHKGCDKKTVIKEWMENLVIDYIHKIIFDDELIEKLADKVMEMYGAENTTLPILKKSMRKRRKVLIAPAQSNSARDFDLACQAENGRLRAPKERAVGSNHERRNGKTDLDKRPSYVLV